jgi:hypothetical protein
MPKGNGDQWVNRTEVRSQTSDRLDVVSQHATKRFWACSCPAWRTRRRCKHLEQLGLPGGEQPFEIGQKRPPPKKGFLDGYRTYDAGGGHGGPAEWRRAFAERLGLDEARATLGRGRPAGGPLAAAGRRPGRPARPRRRGGRPVHALNAPLPPMLLEAVGYGGDAGLVALYFGAGDEAYWDDGRGSATGDLHAYLAYVRHPAVAPHLAGYDLGSSDGPAEHWLLIDRRAGTVAVAPVAEARRLLRGQWPADDTPLTWTAASRRAPAPT